MASFQKHTASYALRYVKNVHRNVPCSKMIIVKSVQIFAACARNNVEKWLQCKNDANKTLGDYPGSYWYIG